MATDPVSMYGIAPPSRRATTSRNTSSSLFIHAAVGIEFAGHGAYSRARIVQIRPSCSRQAGWTSPGSAGSKNTLPLLPGVFSTVPDFVDPLCLHLLGRRGNRTQMGRINERIAEMVAR